MQNRTESAPAGAKSDDRRGSARKFVELPGALIFDGGQDDCVVYDISPRGAQVSASNRIPINHPVTLKLTRHGEFIAKVVWRRHDRMGLLFLHLSEDTDWERSRCDSSIRLISL